jgi:hypothetical protein
MAGRPVIGTVRRRGPERFDLWRLINLVYVEVAGIGQPPRNDLYAAILADR